MRTRVILAAMAAGIVTGGAGLAATALEPEMAAVLGRALFERDWVPGAASTNSADGLGPLFAARGCAGCHAGPALGARFTEVDGKVAARGFVVRLGTAEGAPDPHYGRMAQSQAAPGLTPEARIVLTAANAGGFRYDLGLNEGPLAEGMRESPRIAPPLIGRGAIERVDAAAVMALADPDDRDGDGISGRARIVETAGGPELGRFGWKAGNAGIEEQVADAFSLDMGLSSARRPLAAGDCTEAQAQCRNAPSGESARAGGHELTDEMIAMVAAYVRSLPVPRPQDDPAGTVLFADAGCAACHVPEMAAFGGGTVRVHTDLLLHDMGASLDDGVGERDAASAEWRTAPLIAMAPEGGRRYLHDGRAPDIDTAVRAHAGEGAAARERYVALGVADRAALLRYVEGL